MLASAKAVNARVAFNGSNTPCMAGVIANKPTKANWQGLRESQPALALALPAARPNLSALRVIRVHRSS